MVEAQFSLFDFLSDRYKVTRLELDHPAVTPRHRARMARSVRA